MNQMRLLPVSLPALRDVVGRPELPLTVFRDVVRCSELPLTVFRDVVRCPGLPVSLTALRDVVRRLPLLHETLFYFQ